MDNEKLPLILIVEDGIRVRALIRELIEQSSLRCRIVEACNSKEAFAQVKADVPDIVLMDINLPFVDGIETTRVIKRIAPETRVVMLTIHEDDHYKDQSVRVGAVGYVKKREMTEKLIPVLQEIIIKDLGYSPDRQPKEGYKLL